MYVLAYKPSFLDNFLIKKWVGRGLQQWFSTFLKSRSILKISDHLAEPERSIFNCLQHFQGIQQGIGGTSGFRGTQVEKHWSTI